MLMRQAFWIVITTAMACVIVCSSIPSALAQSTATYELKVRNDWAQEHHKVGAPPLTSVVQPHFSHLGGGTHNDQLVLWEEGGFSSPGMTEMQETGWIDHSNRPDLQTEFDTHMAAGIAHSFLNYPIPNPWFPAGTTTNLEFEINSSHPLVSLVSMLGPSPDWFIGVSGLDLRDATGWKQLVEVDLFPYDGGTRSRDDEFALGGPRENPQKAIARITDTDDTLLKGSLPIGRFTFELMSVSGLECDYDADGDCDQLDLDALYAAGSASDSDIDHWLAAASSSDNPANPLGNTLLRGDVNLDGTVDSVDLGLMLNNFDSTTNLSWSMGNLNDDGIVDSSDLGQLLNNFVDVATVSSVVPEPSSVALLLFALSGMACVRGRRQRCINIVDFP